MPESTIGPAQTTEKTVKKRSKEQKVGRLKYNQELLKRVLSKIEQVQDAQRIILNGLKGAGYFHFDIPMIQKLAAVDQVDLEILECVHNAGRPGILPKNIAKALPEYKMKQYQVTRRIQRMNKRMAFESGEQIFEKRGWRWALTLFALDSYGDVDRRSLEEFVVEPTEENPGER